jgi:hypothetical protein
MTNCNVAGKTPKRFFVEIVRDEAQPPDLIEVVAGRRDYSARFLSAVLECEKTKLR